MSLDLSSWQMVQADDAGDLEALHKAIIEHLSKGNDGDRFIASLFDHKAKTFAKLAPPVKRTTETVKQRRENTARLFRVRDLWNSLDDKSTFVKKVMDQEGYKSVNSAKDWRDKMIAADKAQREADDEAQNRREPKPSVR